MIHSIAALTTTTHREGIEMFRVQIKNMNAEQCMKAIRFLDAKADIAGRPATKSEIALIEKLKARINELDPDGEE